MRQSDFESLQDTMVGTSGITLDPLGVVKIEAQQQQTIYPLSSTSGLEPKMSNVTLLILLD